MPLWLFLYLETIFKMCTLFFGYVYSRFPLLVDEFGNFGSDGGAYSGGCDGGCGGLGVGEISFGDFCSGDWGGGDGSSDGGGGDVNNKSPKVILCGRLLLLGEVLPIETLNLFCG